MGVRVLLVEDDDFTRITLSAALQHHGLDIVATAAGAKEAMASGVAADVGVFDLDLGPGPTGLDVAHGLRRERPGLGIVILTSYEDPRLFSVSLKRLPENATYVVKQSLQDMGFLVEAIHAAASGTPPAHATPPGVDLTDAQIETLRLLACGLTNAEIARVRVVEEKSVEQAVSRIARRLGLDPEPGVNPRVTLARAFYALSGSAVPHSKETPGAPR